MVGGGRLTSQGRRATPCVEDGRDRAMPEHEGAPGRLAKAPLSR